MCMLVWIKFNNMNSTPYKTIDCNFYDRLEAVAIKREKAVFEYMDDQQGETLTVEGTIVDLFIREKAEYLRLNSGMEIRLDRLIRMGEDYLPGTPFCTP